MLRSAFTGAVLVSNVNEKMVSSDAFAVTASKNESAPSARNVLRIEHADEQKDSTIRYG